MWSYIKSKMSGWGSSEKIQHEAARNKQVYHQLKPQNVRQLMLVKASTDPDGLWIKYCKTGTGIVGTVSGILVYASFRKALMLYEGLMLGNLLNGLFAGGFSYGMRKHFYQEKILSGEIYCLPCAMIKGSILQLFTASVIPFFISFGFCGVTATKFEYIKMPSLGFSLPSKEFKDFWRPKFRVISRRMVPLAIIQVAAGSFFAYKEMQCAENLLKKVTPEEVDDLGSNMLRNIGL